jgi:hypothetical protein
MISDFGFGTSTSLSVKFRIFTAKAPRREEIHRFSIVPVWFKIDFIFKFKTQDSRFKII